MPAGFVNGRRDLTRAPWRRVHVWSISGFDQTAISSAFFGRDILYDIGNVFAVSFWISSCARSSSSSDTDLLFKHSEHVVVVAGRVRTVDLGIFPTSC